MPNEYEIEIVDTGLIDGGIEVFARAWKNGVQLGFGKDGSVDIERFRIFNPPILVDDPLGDIVRPYEDAEGVAQERRLREDPEEALKRSLVHIVSLIGKSEATIEVGKIGNTTDTFYPSAGAVSPADGRAYRLATDTTWAGARDTAAGTGASATESQIYAGAELRATGKYEVTRLFFNFDTSTIGSGQQIDTSTFSLYCGSDTTGGGQFGLVQTTPAGNDTVVVGDYDAMTIDSPTEGSARVTHASSQYNDFSMNADGKGWVNTTGVTNLGIRYDYDIDDTTPTARRYRQIYAADSAGTANDPKLVVEHSAPTNAVKSINGLSNVS